MKKKVYVIGHKNPDTDSIVSAIAYAHLKQQLGEDNCIPARAGQYNNQTMYILKRFKLPQTEFISTLEPKVAYYVKEKTPVVNENVPLWNALELLGKTNANMLPIVNDEGIYTSTLHYDAFGHTILTEINPQKKTFLPTSINHILKTLKAQPLLLFNENELSSSHILVAGSAYETVQRSIQLSKNPIVIMGDREDIQELAIKEKVRAIIITGGNVLNTRLRKEAEKNKVSVMTSPFDSFSTCLMTIYSVPVGSISDRTIPSISKHDFIKKIKTELDQSHSECLPVVDSKKHVIGILTESCLVEDPNIELILVDHNEASQAVDGIEHYRIKEIIDHHRLGTISTKYPITFINRPVGATSTIVTLLFKEHQVPIPGNIAGALLCAILADTLFLKSSTTTDIDRETAYYLSQVTGLDIDELERDIQNVVSLVSKKTPEEIISLDRKEYSAADYNLSISQVEVTSFEEIMGKKESILEELGTLNDQKKYLFSSLLVTNVVNLSSILLIKGDEDYISLIKYPRLDNHTFDVGNIVSRKKQLVPFLVNMVEKF